MVTCSMYISSIVFNILNKSVFSFLKIVVNHSDINNRNQSFKTVFHIFESVFHKQKKTNNI